MSDPLNHENPENHEIHHFRAVPDVKPRILSRGALRERTRSAFSLREIGVQAELVGGNLLSAPSWPSVQKILVFLTLNGSREKSQRSIEL